MTAYLHSLACTNAPCSRALHQLANLRAMQRTARALKGVEQQRLPWAV